MNEDRPFELSDIEDVRVIIKAKGKHYAIVPKEGITNEEGIKSRVEWFSLLTMVHDIVDVPLEDLKERLKVKLT